MILLRRPSRILDPKGHLEIGHLERISYKVWGSPGPPPNTPPRARNRPPKAGNEVSRPFRTPDLHKIEERHTPRRPARLEIHVDLTSGPRSKAQQDPDDQ